MNEIKMRFFTYRFPFKRAFTNATNTFECRKGIFIQLRKNGITAWGEAAPLPGFSRETLHEVRSQIQRLQPKITSLFSSEFSPDDLNAFFDNYHVLPSLQFGLFTLSCFFLAQREQQSVQQLLFPDAPSQLNLNAVIDLNQHIACEQINNLIKNGFHTLKIKAVNSARFISILKKVRRHYPGLKIRLDANQSWSIEQAICFLQKVEPLNIEYCEEPLQNPDVASLTKLSQQTNVPIALDESLANIFELKEAVEPAAVLIIKPMLLGANYDHNLLKSLGKKAKLVYTSSLESGIGRLMTAVLAAGLGTRNIAHGIATGRLLAKDSWSDERFIKNGSFLLPKADVLPSLMQIELNSFEQKEIII